MSNNNDSFSMADLTAALNQEGRAGLVNPPNSEWRGFAGTLSSIAENVTPKVEELRKIQRQHDKLNAMLTEEREALEAKYQKLYQPLYNQRFDIVNGLVEVDAAAAEAGMDQGEATNSENFDAEKRLPDFWIVAMKNNDFLVEKISEYDEAALKYLKDIKWSRIKKSEGFKLEFFFDPNPYFKNSVLTKTYYMISEEACIFGKVIGTEIEWYSGKCFTQKLLKKKQPRKGSKNVKPVTMTKYCKSFFNFFYPYRVPERVDEDNFEEQRRKIEQDYYIGLTIRDEIIPCAVLWFTREAMKLMI